MRGNWDKFGIPGFLSNDKNLSFLWNFEKHYSMVNLAKIKKYSEIWKTPFTNANLNTFNFPDEVPLTVCTKKGFLPDSVKIGPFVQHEVRQSFN